LRGHTARTLVRCWQWESKRGLQWVEKGREQNKNNTRGGRKRDGGQTHGKSLGKWVSKGDQYREKRRIGETSQKKLNVFWRINRRRG